MSLYETYFIYLQLHSQLRFNVTVNVNSSLNEKTFEKCYHNRSAAQSSFHIPLSVRRKYFQQ